MCKINCLLFRCLNAVDVFAAKSCAHGTGKNLKQVIKDNVTICADDRARLVSGVRYVAPSASGIGQTEEQITRGRRDGHAVGAVGRGHSAAITNPARRAQDTIGLQGVTARIRPRNDHAVRGRERNRQRDFGQQIPQQSCHTKQIVGVAHDDCTTDLIQRNCSPRSLPASPKLTTTSPPMP